jgi:hypothetical protein
MMASLVSWRACSSQDGSRWRARWPCLRVSQSLLATALRCPLSQAAPLPLTAGHVLRTRLVALSRWNDGTRSLAWPLRRAARPRPRGRVATTASSSAVEGATGGSRRASGSRRERSPAIRLCASATAVTGPGAALVPGAATARFAAGIVGVAGEAIAAACATAARACAAPGVPARATAACACAAPGVPARATAACACAPGVPARATAACACAAVGVAAHATAACACAPVGVAARATPGAC